VRLLHFDKPLDVVMDGKAGHGMIFKPKAEEQGNLNVPG